MDTTLWVNEAGDRYFLIPNNITVQPGPYIILSLLQGRRANVSEAALGSFEIGADAAREYFQVVAGPPFEQTVRLLTGRQPDPQAGRALLRQVLAALLGIAPEQLDAHPTLLNTGAADILAQIAEAIHTAAEPGAGQRALARVQLRKLRKQLRAQGIPVSNQLDQIAEQLPHYQERIAALAEQCADLLRDTTTDPEEQLRMLFDTLERDFGSLVESEEERQRRDEQRRREYRKSADDAIARSLRAHGISPTLDRNKDS